MVSLEMFNCLRIWPIDLTVRSLTLIAISRYPDGILTQKIAPVSRGGSSILHTIMLRQPDVTKLAYHTLMLAQ